MMFIYVRNERVQKSFCILQEAKVHASTNGQLRAQVEDYKVSLHLRLCSK